MKTTIDLPALLLRKARSLSAERGESMDNFVADAIRARISALEPGIAPEPTQPGWLAHFGELAPYRTEIEAMHKEIDAAFEQIDPEDWK